MGNHPPQLSNGHSGGAARDPLWQRSRADVAGRGRAPARSSIALRRSMQPDILRGEANRMRLPSNMDLYYGGRWHMPNGGYAPTFDPASGRVLADAPVANATDV